MILRQMDLKKEFSSSGNGELFVTEDNWETCFRAQYRQLRAAAGLQKGCWEKFACMPVILNHFWEIIIKALQQYFFWVVSVHLRAEVKLEAEK